MNAYYFIEKLKIILLVFFANRFPGNMRTLDFGQKLITKKKGEQMIA